MLFIGGHRVTTETGWVAHITDEGTNNYGGNPKLMCRVHRKNLIDAPKDYPVCKACQRVMEVRARGQRRRRYEAERY